MMLLSERDVHCVPKEATVAAKLLILSWLASLAVSKAFCLPVLRALDIMGLYKVTKRHSYACLCQ